jgi:hypothetical protein
VSAVTLCYLIVRYLCTASQSVWLCFLNCVLRSQWLGGWTEKRGCYKHAIYTHTLVHSYCVILSLRLQYRSWPFSILLSIFERKRLELTLMLFVRRAHPFTASPPLFVPLPRPISAVRTEAGMIAVCPISHSRWRSVPCCDINYGILILGPNFIASILWTDHRLISLDGYSSLLYVLHCIVSVCA